ncbi:MAG: hypothetical protein PHC83_04540 [Bacteroidales bacterium]|nr:hypothetical protein [Bacteroidales bacterium]MDD3280821.1 hypothetical protein [Bacteroidales bacterium]MDD4210720.1 hypothetical protein [Bacteroidales bacterium]
MEAKHLLNVSRNLIPIIECVFMSSHACIDDVPNSLKRRPHLVSTSMGARNKLSAGSV